MKNNIENTVVKALVVAMLVLNSQYAIADYDTVSNLVDKYNQAGDGDTRKDAASKLSKAEPKTSDDMKSLRTIFSQKNWNMGLYEVGIQSIENIKDPALDEGLISILQDEKPIMAKAATKDYGGKTEQELLQRNRNVMIILKKLGKLKSKNAAAILKEYLAIKGLQYYASEALANIGDKSASEDLRQRAYKGEEVNYGGLGADEADTIIQDLQDEGKKDKWKNIAKQLIDIRSTKAKPGLRKLFAHKDNYVRANAATAFANMVDKDDANNILEMSTNNDWGVRYEAIKAMMHLRDVSFDDTLINILVNDRHRGPRSNAAHALGYKKVQKAVPYLEKALNDEDNFVRRESFIALYVLTGKKYDFKGRTPLLDRVAEDQSKHPSIY